MDSGSYISGIHISFEQYELTAWRDNTWKDELESWQVVLEAVILYYSSILIYEVSESLGSQHASQFQQAKFCARIPQSSRSQILLKVWCRQYCRE